MMYDPEELAAARRRRDQQSEPARLPLDPPPISPQAAETQRLLDSIRGDGDRDRQWLCIVRSDKRSSTVDELQRAIDDIAHKHDVTTEFVRQALDRALRAEGSCLRSWFDRLASHRPMPPLGLARRRLQEQHT